MIQTLLAEKWGGAELWKVWKIWHCWNSSWLISVLFEPQKVTGTKRKPAEEAKEDTLALNDVPHIWIQVALGDLVKIGKADAYMYLHLVSTIHSHNDLVKILFFSTRSTLSFYSSLKCPTSRWQSNLERVIQTWRCISWQIFFCASQIASYSKLIVSNGSIHFSSLVAVAKNEREKTQLFKNSM